MAIACSASDADLEQYIRNKENIIQRTRLCHYFKEAKKKVRSKLRRLCKQRHGDMMNIQSRLASTMRQTTEDDWKAKLAEELQCELYTHRYVTKLEEESLSGVIDHIQSIITQVSPSVTETSAHNRAKQMERKFLFLVNETADIYTCEACTGPIQPGEPYAVVARQTSIKSHVRSKCMQNLSRHGNIKDMAMLLDAALDVV